MSDKPYPFTPEQEAWLRDLETTEAPQTSCFLHDKFGYCCLGRACVTLGVEEKVEHEIGWFDGHDSILSEAIFEKLHLRDGEGTLEMKTDNGRQSLVEMNDHGRMSFKEIAAYIRANPWNVFLDPNEVKYDDA